MKSVKPPHTKQKWKGKRHLMIQILSEMAGGELNLILFLELISGSIHIDSSLTAKGFSKPNLE